LSSKIIVNYHTNEMYICVDFSISMLYFVTFMAYPKLFHNGLQSVAYFAKFARL